MLLWFFLWRPELWAFQKVFLNPKRAWNTPESILPKSAPVAAMGKRQVWCSNRNFCEVEKRSKDSSYVHFCQNARTTIYRYQESRTAIEILRLTKVFISAICFLKFVHVSDWSLRDASPVVRISNFFRSSILPLRMREEHFQGLDTQEFRGPPLSRPSKCKSQCQREGCLCWQWSYWRWKNGVDKVRQWIFPGRPSGTSSAWERRSSGLVV